MRAMALVDGATSIAAVVRTQLSNAGIQTYIPTDPDDAWNYLVTETPDAAVIDIEVSGANGWQLVERIRKDGRYVALPIVVLTGMGEPGAMEAAANSLHCESLTKTMAGSRLAEVLKQAIAQPAQHVALDQSPKVDLKRVAVMMLVHEFQIEGTVYLPSELNRFSDAWEAVIRDSRVFVPVTDVTIRTSDGNQVGTTGFMNIKKTEIRAVYPRD